VIGEEDNVDEMINKICYELSLEGRKRIRSSYYNEDDYSYSDY